MVILNVIFKLAILGSILLSGICFSQVKTYSFEEIKNLQQSEKRNIAVFIGTDWCNYCKAMENTTFKNKKIIEVLNQKFYFIKLNAEEKRIIHFAGKSFSYKPTGTNTVIHGLAEELTFSNETKNTASYPYLIFLNESNEIIFQHSGFLNAKELVHVLKEASKLQQ